MANYYVNRNAQDNGDHEVHTGTCDWLPKEANRIYLGQFASCHGAVIEAGKHYNQVDGCKHCCLQCHTS